jgi:hypothetical protein
MPSKPKKLHHLELTREQLIHVRDLMAVLLPREERCTLSQGLAGLEERSAAEAELWTNVASLCKKARIPLDGGAPDFVVTASSSPPLDVFRIERSESGE